MARRTSAHFQFRGGRKNQGTHSLPLTVYDKMSIAKWCAPGTLLHLPLCDLDPHREGDVWAGGASSAG
jgi:hypothetical protein